MNADKAKRLLEKRNITFRILLFFVAVALAALLIRNYGEYKAARDDLAQAIEAENAQRLINERLQTELDAPVDDEYIEKVAKEKLGYRKPAEIIFYNDIYE